MFALAERDHIRLTRISGGAAEEVNLKHENHETREMYEEYGIEHLQTDQSPGSQ